MPIAALYDVHGNLPALEAVLAGELASKRAPPIGGPDAPAIHAHGIEVTLPYNVSAGD